VLKEMCKGKGAEAAVKELGLQRMDGEEARSVVAMIVREREAFVREKGMSAVGPLMAPVMERLRGKVDGKAASEMLRQEIAALLEGN
jgi:glutamyl-tRNA(Gln) amidotransferase subunit E